LLAQADGIVNLSRRWIVERKRARPESERHLVQRHRSPMAKVIIWARPSERHMSLHEPRSSLSILFAPIGPTVARGKDAVRLP